VEGSLHFAELTNEPLNQESLVARVESARHGALVTFRGNVRDNAMGKHVLALAYHAYEKLAQKALLRIAQDVEARWDASCAIAHRLGDIPIGEASVVIAVATAHRQDAFEACRWAIDTLKETVPIWKKETYEDAEVWIEGEMAIENGHSEYNR
jgi:molybdopterin synthase catalytic subunit